MKKAFPCFRIYSCFLLSLLPCLADSTPGDENWDGGFNLPAGVNGDVTSVASLGKDIYIAGHFTKAGNVAAKGIARWDGTNWFPVGAGVSGEIFVMMAQGKDLFVGGRFTSDGSIVATNIAKWNGEQWETLGAGIPSVFSNQVAVSSQFVFALAVQGNDLIVGGNFDLPVANGSEAINIAKWDGKKWSALGSGLGGPPGDLFGLRLGYIRALAVHNGDLYAGGRFHRAGGVPCSNLARWDGKQWSDIGGGVSGGSYGIIIEGQVYYGEVYGLASQQQELYVAGDFTTAGSREAKYVASWNGSAWSEIGGGLTGIATTVVSRDHEAYVGGNFDQAGNIAAPGVVRWNGSSWNALGVGVIGQVSALDFVGKSLYVGGTFGLAGGKQTGSVAQWDGQTWSSLGNGTGNALVGRVETGGIAAGDGQVVVGGQLFSAGTIEAHNLVKLNGKEWSRVDGGITGGYIQKVAVSGSNVYVAGSFVIPQVGATNLARWNGSQWASLGDGLSVANITSMAASGNNFYVGGYFTSVGGVEVANLAGWDGSSWSALGGGVSINGYQQGYVQALAAAGGKLYVGGYFDHAGSIAASNLAVWDGVSWSSIGSGPFTDQNSSILALAVQGNNLFVFGYTYLGNVNTMVVVWNGSTWSDPIATNINIGSMTATAANLYVAGYFTTVAGLPANNIARWDGTNWFPLGSGVDDLAGSLAADARNVYAGGYFLNAGGKSSYHFAVWHEPLP